MVIGYAGMDRDVVVDLSGENGLAAWPRQLDVRKGLVGDMFPGGRDRVFYQPCFEIRIATDGGMSGGPVFTNGGLCGVLSVGADDSHYSLASFIATSYYLRIHCDVGAGLQAFSILDLVHLGYIQAGGPTFEINEHGERYEIVWISDEDGVPPVTA